ncbi:MAG: UDP-N-acetylglucosamine 1-carboxyvinyltransferase, partial [Gemmiger sp.]
MEKFVIHGGKPLTGDVTIGGAKNAAVAILPATILAGGKCLVENLPCISDVMASLQILSELGASIRMISRNTYEIDTSHIDCTEVS